MCWLSSTLVEGSKRDHLCAYIAMTAGEINALVGWCGHRSTDQDDIQYTFWRYCSHELEGMVIREIVVDGSSHCVIKSPVSNLLSRGREKIMPLLGHVSSSQSIP